ncbi:antitoxin Xre/MbcA/ParS toxin-binding domain-containing protein [Eoetvoesiella caeni]|uniref:Putative toxin-antitoxin system antitoxin component (TIGR02293 family) n=1 Tax=Eoetvoesiella caeni TaxID=645616 RepID=A0A366H2A2_9BURK|nr:antitoxin Xre/MbcA/ParS toxin-binding domain-containing protein [Eoetvoesiella caeni]MCI2811079.1 DUF2384 domain-containing protein [Eoetvoesiella caeni]NYT57009.1 DUF2384 domain-containing protein [Eoetvoesiella caeni]RBP35171.1 putative toxin-antitoxin system antitoxin component (TIGR02293 family) [Eoetvoesiella caeni]
MLFDDKAVREMPLVSASRIESEGWPCVKSVLSQTGRVAITEDGKVTAFVLSIAEYEQLLPEDRPKDLAALRKRFDARLAVLNEPGAGDRLRSVMDAPVKPRLEGTSDGTKCSELLGGVYVLGRVPSMFEWIRLMREGLPFSCMDAFCDRLGLSLPQLIDEVGVSSVAIGASRQSGKLTKEQSIRLLRMARVVEYGCEVFESVAATRDWLRAPNISLGDVPPMSLLDTEFGAELVRRAIRNIEYGLPV